MSVIRPLERDDLPQVAILYESVSRSGSTTPPRGLAGYFERTLLDHPWADPEIPSLVNLNEQGTVRGFIESHVRRLSLEGRPILMACGGQLVSDPAVRNRAAGRLLLRRFFAGPQDLTITDGATEATRRMWRGLGESVGRLGSISWVRLFDWGAAGEQALEGFGMAPWRPVVRPVLSAEMPAVRSRGELVKRLIRDGDRVLGWYVAYLQRWGLSQVMQIPARNRDVAGVLDHLFHDAQSAGVAALTGQLGPSLFEALPQRSRRCFLHLSANFLVHSRNPEVLNPILLGQAMITRMDGERWMGHHLESFT